MVNILIALGFTFAVGLSLRHVLDYDPDGTVVVTTYLLFYGLIAWMRSSSETDTIPDDDLPDRSEWPIPGPFNSLGSKAGRFLFLSVFWTTHLLSLVNPFQLLQIARQLIGLLKLRIRRQKLDHDGSEYQTKANYSFPFRGEWLVYNGGITPQTSHSWDILGQRFAIDFVQADSDFSRHTGKGTRLDDYYCYGEDILAASSGVVIRIEDRISNAPFVGFGLCDFMARSFIGNHVIIEHAENEYALYAHLIKGSVCVQPGEKVVQGQIIGRCGHSGHSSEPHLHFHLQDSSDIFNGMGLPIRFDTAEIDGNKTTNRHVTAGQRVRNISPRLEGTEEDKQRAANDWEHDG